jgi:phytanoyl-CoA hydroxylase
MNHRKTAVVSENKFETIKQEYTENGYLLVRDFFPVEIIEAIAEETERFDSNFTQNLNKADYALEETKIKYLKHLQIYAPSAAKLLSGSLYGFLKGIFDDNYYFSLMELHNKFPGASCTPAHQDNFYFCLEKGNALTAYIALTPQDRINGGLGVIPKSHTKVYEHHQSGTIAFSSGINLTQEEHENADFYMLNPGDLAIHHCNIIHLADANTSDRQRKAISMRFFGFDDQVSAEKKAKYQAFMKKNRGL